MSSLQAHELSQMSDPGSSAAAPGGAIYAWGYARAQGSRLDALGPNEGKARSPAEVAVVSTAPITPLLQAVPLLATLICQSLHQSER
jgi:hypothetical protein